MPLSWFVSAGASADMPGLLLEEPFQSENPRFLQLIFCYYSKTRIYQCSSIFFANVFFFLFFLSLKVITFFSPLIALFLDSNVHQTFFLHPLQWFPKKRTVRQDWDIMDFQHVAVLRQTFVTLRGRDFCIWFFRLTGQQSANPVSILQWKSKASSESYHCLESHFNSFICFNKCSFNCFWDANRCCWALGEVIVIKYPDELIQQLVCPVFLSSLECMQAVLLANFNLYLGNFFFLFIQFCCNKAVETMWTIEFFESLF